MKNGFLPISKEDMREAGIDQLDFVYVCGDAYVDHPSFGHAIISRLLEAHGYKVGIIAQRQHRYLSCICMFSFFLSACQCRRSSCNSSSVSGRYSPGASSSGNTSDPISTRFR